MADIVEENGQPTLKNKVELLRAKRPECTLEAQDFRARLERLAEPAPPEGAGV